MRQRGILQALLSGFCFGFLGLFGKIAFAQSLKPGEFLSLRFLLASSALGAWLLLTRPRSLLLPRSVLLRCAALGTGGYALFSSCFFLSLNGLSASLTVLLLYTYPVLVSLGAWIFFGEKLKGTHLVALPIVCVGLGLLVWGELEVRSFSALVLGFLSSLFYSVYILTSSRWLKGVDPFASVFYIMLSAGLTLGLLHLRPSTFPLTGVSWATLGAAAVLSSVFAMGLFLAALQKLSNHEISLLSTAEPITGVLVATVLLGERMLPPQILGGALILAGMLLVAMAQGKKRPT